jgi:hypothetical protein
MRYNRVMANPEKEQPDFMVAYTEPEHYTTDRYIFLNQVQKNPRIVSGDFLNCFIVKEYTYEQNEDFAFMERLATAMRLTMSPNPDFGDEEFVKDVKDFCKGKPKVLFGLAMMMETYTYQVEKIWKMTTENLKKVEMQMKKMEKDIVLSSETEDKFNIGLVPEELPKWIFETLKAGLDDQFGREIVIAHFPRQEWEGGYITSEQIDELKKVVGEEEIERVKNATRIAFLRAWSDGEK